MRAIITTAVGAATAFALAGCGLGGGNPAPSYAPDAAAGFTYDAWQVEAAGVDDYDAMALDADDFVGDLIFQPEECASMYTIADLFLPADEPDPDAQRQRFDPVEFDDDDYYYWVTARYFSTPEQAEQFVDRVIASVEPCADGYLETGEDGVYLVESVTTASAWVAGFGEVHTVAEAAEYIATDGDSNDDDWRMSFGARGNYVLAVSLGGTADDLDGADFVDGLVAFAAHLDESVE